MFFFTKFASQQRLRFFLLIFLIKINNCDKERRFQGKGRYDEQTNRLVFIYRIFLRLIIYKYISIIMDNQRGKVVS